MSKRANADITGEWLAFRTQLLTLISPILEADYKSHGGFRPGGRNSLSTRELLIVDSLGNFSEINDSVRRLEEISVLLRYSPPKQWGMSKPSFLQFLIESYLQEIYVLRNRLTTYATWIAKRLHRSHQENRVTLSRLNRQMIKSFEGRSDTRSQFVHNHRYTDKELTDAFAYQLIAEHKGIGDEESEVRMWRRAASHSYLKARKTFNKTVAEDKLAIEQLLQHYFQVLNPIVFNALLK